MDEAVLTTKDWGAIDISKISAWLLGQDPAVWTEATMRQERYPVHRETENILFLFPDRKAETDRFYVRPYPRAGQTADFFHDIVTEIKTLVGMSTLEPSFVVASRLGAGKQVYPHTDGQHASYRLMRRFMIALVETGTFLMNGEPVATPLGHAVEINGQIAHSVQNDSAMARVDLIIDLYDATDPAIAGKRSWMPLA